MKSNRNFPLNPNCRNPSISGKKHSDRWSVYFYYYDPSNKRRITRILKGLNDKGQSLTDRRKKSKEILKETLEKLKTRKFNIIKGYFEGVDTEAQTVASLIDEYLKFVKPKLGIYTYRSYNTAFEQFKKYVGGLSLSWIDKQTIKSFLQQLKIKPQSKRSYRTYISVFFNWLIEVKGVQIANPTHGARIENSHPVERHKVYSKEEIQSIIEYCDLKGKPILKTIIYLVYGAQMRISEVLRIQLKDFQFDRNRILLPKGKAKVKNREKIVLLDGPLKAYLLALNIDYSNPEMQDQYFIGIDQAYSKSKFVGKFPLSKDTVDTQYKALKTDLNLPANKTLYGFKHTGNVNLLLNGADLLELMFKNGHTKVSQTETYLRQLIEQVPEMKYIRKTRDDLDFL